MRTVVVTDPPRADVGEAGKLGVFGSGPHEHAIRQTFFRYVYRGLQTIPSFHTHGTPPVQQ